ncbi:hypothetical protein D3C85_1897030 [compost metagenome]
MPTARLTLFSLTSTLLFSMRYSARLALMPPCSYLPPTSCTMPRSGSKLMPSLAVLGLNDSL